MLFRAQSGSNSITREHGAQRSTGTITSPVSSGSRSHLDFLQAIVWSSSSQKSARLPQWQHYAQGRGVLAITAPLFGLGKVNLGNLKSSGRVRLEPNIASFIPLPQITPSVARIERRNIPRRGHDKAETKTWSQRAVLSVANEKFVLLDCSWEIVI